MSVFSLSDFERQGNIENDIQFSGLPELKSCILELSSECLRSVRLFTPDLETDVYSDPAFVERLVSLCRGNRHASIQIMVCDLSPAIQRGHLLLNLAQTLTSSIEIRVPSDEYRDTGLSFMVLDNKAFVYRPDTKYMAGIANADCKFRAAMLSEIFQNGWEHAEQDPQTRNLKI